MTLHDEQSGPEPNPVDEITDDDVLALDSYREALQAGQRITPEDWVRTHPRAGSALQAFRALAALHDPEHTQPEHARTETPASAPEQASVATANLFSPQPPEIPGYEFLGLCGRGGRGVVWKARRMALGRVEAVKMILAGQFADVAEVERFLREVKLAAGLSHPNIVKVHDAGIVAGQPYLTMEYIDGKTLAQLAQGPDALPVRKAAEFVKTVALAVQYLHEHNILHRDLKPANVLLSVVSGPLSVAKKPEGKTTDHGQLTTDYVPKITDFGLAKQIEGGSALTGSGDVIGSPSYMPPEQAAGRITQLGPWSDVYGLGAILYELLAGRPPFRAETRGATIHQVLDSNLEPVVPSRLNPDVDRDLDTICTKALAKEPSRRYHTARDLAEDIERWLNGEPIHARPVGRVERFWRWCRRKPAVASLAAAFVVAVISGIASVTWQWARAETNFRRANQSLDELSTTYNRLGELLGQVRSKAEALELYQRGRATLERLVQDNPTNTSFQSALAGCYMNIGNRQGDLGQPDAARESYRAAIDLWEKLVRESPAMAGFQKELAKTYSNLGVLQRQTGQLEQARHSYQKAIEIRERLVRDDPTSVDYRNELASSHHNLGVLQSHVGQLADGLASFQRAYEIRERLVQDNPDLPEIQGVFAGPCNRIAAVQAAMGRADEARVFHEKTREIREKLAHDYPAVVAHQTALGDALLDIGSFLAQTGEHAEAIVSYRRVCEIMEKLVSADPAVTDYQVLLAAANGNLGLMLSRSNPTDALGFYEKARDRLEKLVLQVPSSSRYKTELATAYDAIGNLLSDVHPPADALRSYQKALEMREQLVLENPEVLEYRRNVAATHNNIATFHDATNQPAEALRSYERAREIREQLARDYPDAPQYQSELCEIYRNIGDHWREAGRLAEALKSLKQTREVYDKLIEKHPGDPKYPSDLGRTLHMIGSILAQMGRHEEALPAYEQAIGHQRAALARAPETSEYRGLLSKHYSALAREQRELRRPVDATRTALERKKFWPDNANELYDVACELALCVPLIEQRKSDLSADEQTERQKYIDQAIEVLREAIANGFQDFEHMQKDSDLDAIREHARYKELIGRRPD
ncbi:MAG: tetratricopeptide repeat protein [Planctomycetes bacterium]|nr:tetratricopeptide repeat protein [Planctomycetota bacterium]